RTSSSLWSPTPPRSTLFPYTTLFRSEIRREALQLHTSRIFDNPQWVGYLPFNKRYRPEIWDAANIVFVRMKCCPKPGAVTQEQRSEEHTSELQSRFDLVCRLLLEKKN